MSIHNAQQTSTFPVDIKPDMAVIVHNSEPVVTTELLANFYGTEVNNLQVNYHRNAARFIEGKHFFKLEGDSLRDIKRRLTDSKSVKVARNVRSLILWTERGAARHAKMLETDQAWSVFEKLEDCYFSKKEASQTAVVASSSGRITIEQQDIIKRLVKEKVEALPKDRQAKGAITCWSAIKSKFGASYKDLPEENFVDMVSLVARITLDGEVIALPVIKRYSYQDGRDAIERLRSMALVSLTGNTRELVLRDCKDAEESLIKGWTEVDEAIIRLSTVTGMLRRWRDVN